MRPSLIVLLLAFCMTVAPLSGRGQTFQTLFVDDQAMAPSGKVVQTSNGTVFGTTTSGGTSGNGAVFKLAPEGALSTLVSFDGTNGKTPSSGLILGNDGNFYGTTKSGGTNNLGTVFKVTPEGVLTSLASFDGSNGRTPSTGLVLGSDGNFYGTTELGGANNRGTVFKVTSEGVLTALFSFSGANGENPRAELCLGIDGNLYGTTVSGGANGRGTVFKITPDGELTTLISFNGTNGGFPTTGLTQGDDGSFYGTTNSGGVNSKGFIFRITPDGEFTALASIASWVGSSERSTLVQGNDGNFYGTFQSNFDYGGIYKVTPTGELTKFISFYGTNGSAPVGRLLQGNDGNLYGTTSSGGKGGSGTVFKVTPAGELTILSQFKTSGTSYLTKAADGTLYGVNTDGGVGGHGNIFKLSPEGKQIGLLSFGGSNGSRPSAALRQGSDGNFYGTTAEGGNNNNGTIFRMSPAGVLTSLVSFSGYDGRNPVGDLMQASDGNFYGTTMKGGRDNGTEPQDFGTVFRMTPSGALTTLYSCYRPNTSSFGVLSIYYPLGGLVEGADGSLYGTTSESAWITFPSSAGWGFTQYHGAVFSLTTAGQPGFQNIFGSDTVGGAYPAATLVKGIDGRLYGTTREGGAMNHGTAFAFAPGGGSWMKVSFDGTNGSMPSGGLVQGSDGNFYGVTSKGGALGYGTVFRVTPAGVLTVFHSFDGAPVAYPTGTPVFGADGKLYGTAEQSAIWSLALPVPTLTLAPASEITDLGAALTCKVNAHLSDTNVTLEYGPTPALGNSAPVTPGTVSGNIETTVSAKLAGLTPNTIYYYRFTATSAAGTTSTTTASLVTERVAGSPRAPQVHLLFPSSSSLTPTFIGTVNANGAETTVVLEYGYGPTPTYGNSVAVGVVSGANPTVVSASIGQQSPSAYIHYRLTATNSEGTTSTIVAYWSPNLGTGADFPDVLQLAPSGVTLTGATLNGVVKSNGADTAVTFEYGLTPEYGSSIAAIPGTVERTGPAGVNVSATLTGLAPNTTYYYRIVATNSVGTARTTAASFTTSVNGKVGSPQPYLLAPSDVTLTSMTLNGTVDAYGSNTTVRFEYGLTIAYGNSVTATPEIVSATSPSAVSAILTGLSPHTTYYYRIVASSSEGTTSTVGGSFTTANRLPVAVNDSLAPDPTTSGAFFIPALANDSDPDGDPLTITAVTQGAFGTVSTNGQKLTYTPKATFVGQDTFTYTISDGVDTATATVELRATENFLRILFGTNSQVPGAGALGSEVAAGSVFGKVGMPAINSAGALAFTAKYGPIGAANETSVLVVNPQGSATKVAARVGQTAPGTEGALFVAFKDPLLNEAGDVAFLATLTGGDTRRNSNNKGGIWLNPASAASTGTQLIARTGVQAVGVPDGARWKSFTNVVLSSSNTEEGSWALAFTGYLSTGSGGVKASNDMGLWIASPSGTVLALRENQKLRLDPNSIAEKQIRSFAALMPLTGTTGQGNGVAQDGAVAVQASFTDGSQAILRVSPDAVPAVGATSVTDAVSIEVLVLPGDPVVGVSETAAKFGIPSQSASGATTAWIGTLSGKTGTSAIFERSQSASELLKLVARKGGTNTGVEGARFGSFKNVVVNDNGHALFQGKLIGNRKAVTANSDEGLWWKKPGRGEASESFTLQLLAREGARPPGLPEGAKWQFFSSVALMDGPYGPLFTAKMVAASKGNMGPGGVTSNSDQGLWAVDSSGQLRLIVREYQSFAVNRESNTTIKGFTVLSAVPGSSMQRRSFTDQGQIVLYVTFPNGGQGIMKVQVP